VAIIEVNDLVFDYPGTRALNHVSLQIEAGSITALVGPNGAGKTSLLRCLAALETPVSGEIRVAGIDVLSDPRSCHRQLGYLSDFFGIYGELTVRQCLLHAAASHGIGADGQQEAVDLAARRLGIAGRLSDAAGTLSRGLRQRLAIAQAIVHQPHILLLDEPASGLDPEARHSLAELFLALRDEGMTLVVSSHILSELDEYSSDMLVLRQGRILSHAPIVSSRQSLVQMRVRTSEPLADLGRILGEIEGISGIRLEESAATFTYSADRKAQHALILELLQRGVPLCAFAEEKRNLHLAYLDSVRNGGPKEVKA